VLWVTVRRPNSISRWTPFAAIKRLGRSFQSSMDRSCGEAAATVRHRSRRAATIAVESERVSPGVIIQRSPFGSPFARLVVSSRGGHRLARELETLRQFGFMRKLMSEPFA